MVYHTMLHLHPYMVWDLQKINGVFELLWCRERYPKMAFWIRVSNILWCGTPKVRWRMEKTLPFFKGNVDDAVRLKSTPFQHFFWTWVRSQSCGKWTPRGMFLTTWKLVWGLSNVATTNVCKVDSKYWNTIVRYRLMKWLVTRSRGKKHP